MSDLDLALRNLGTRGERGLLDRLFPTQLTIMKFPRMLMRMREVYAFSSSKVSRGRQATGLCRSWL